MTSEYRTLAAIDVHKRVLMVVVVRKEAPTAVVAQERFLTTRSEIRRLALWLQSHGVEAVVMESTAQYWWPVWVELEGQFALRLAQARSNRGPRGRKTDFGDACRLARRYWSGDLCFSFVPGVEQRSWRRLARTWKSLGEQIVEIRNEIEALLEEGQIKLAAVVSDLLGASGRRVLEALAEGETDSRVLAQKFDRRVRASERERQEALEGRLPAAHRLVLKQHLERIGVLERQQQELEQELTRQMKPVEEQVRRLTQVPGIHVVAAQHLIAELGPDCAAFPSARQAASWVGVCPGRQESAGQSSSDASPKGNRFVRGLLCQVAHAAVRTKDSYWESLFQRWVRRMPAAKALWAVAHRLLRLIWKLLAQRVDYEERGPRQWDTARLAARMKRLRAEFRRYGYEVTFQPAHCESTT